jgi:hypothetical protein
LLAGTVTVPLSLSDLLHVFSLGSGDGFEVRVRVRVRVRVLMLESNLVVRVKGSRKGAAKAV